MRSKPISIMLTAAILLVAAAIPLSASQRIVYVDEDANVPGDGSSWQTAYRFLQDALADANDLEKPVEIRVAQGIYKPDRSSAHPDGTRDRSASFRLLDDVAIMGGFAGIVASDPNVRDIALYETILSGDLAGDDAPVADPCDLLTEPTRTENSYTVVTAGPCSRSAILDGFTIRSGNALASKLSAGAGLHLWVYSAPCCPSIRNCTFAGNLADNAGAVAVSGARPELINCAFLENAAIWGGAMGNSLARLSAPTGCDFVIRGCTFTRNYARESGGAMLIGPGAPSIIEGCTFTRNFARTGGAVYIDFSGTTNIANCLFIHNVADRSGGAVYSAGYGLKIISCTLAGNAAPVGLALTCFTPVTTITNTIFWNGGDERHGEIFIGAITGMSITYSNIRDDWPPGAGNIDTDPLFANPGHWDPNGRADDPNDNFWVDGDYHLKSPAGRWDATSEDWVLDNVTSPCIDAGDPNSPVADEPEPNGGRVNMGAFSGTAEASKSYVGEQLP
jgi:predicted outer membrane repeat protein